MGMTSEISQDLYRPAECRFGVHDPVLMMYPAQEPTELLRFRQRGGGPRAAQTFAPAEAFESGAETRHCIPHKPSADPESEAICCVMRLTGLNAWLDSMQPVLKGA
jgi:hypothetical protein